MEYEYTRDEFIQLMDDIKNPIERDQLFFKYLISSILQYLLLVYNHNISLVRFVVLIYDIIKIRYPHVYYPEFCFDMVYTRIKNNIQIRCPRIGLFNDQTPMDY